MRMQLLAAATAAIAFVGLAPAHAADAVTYEPPLVLDEEVASAIDFAFGVAFTSRYVSRGIAQSDGPTVQGYVEASYDWAYLGVWASGVDFFDEFGARTDRVEIDLYGGIRPTFGDLTVDIGYAHYFYDRTGSCCGEIYVKPTYQLTDDFALGVEYYHDIEFDTNYAIAVAELALPYDFTLSGGVGTRFIGREGVDWNVGLSYTYAELVTFDVRYHDSRLDTDRIVASVAFDTSFDTVRTFFAGGTAGGGAAGGGL